MSSPITVTPFAQEHIKTLLAGRGKPSEGVRLGVRSKGCSGLSYNLEFADDLSVFDEIIELKCGVKLMIDPKAMMFILGTEMDYEVNNLEEGFIFRNPNEKGRCGCGESFHI